MMKNCPKCKEKFKPKRKEQKYCSTLCSNTRHIDYNMLGKTFGQLTVIFPSNETALRGEFRWICQCVCGNFTTVGTSNLRSGAVKSCGCVGRQKTKLRNFRHGFTHTRFYVIYRGIRERCENPTADNYRWYGGKGVKCRWKTFHEFKNDMYEDYLKHVQIHGEKNTTIDRLNPDGDYCKENCVWATWEEQRTSRDEKGRYTKGTIKIAKQPTIAVGSLPVSNQSLISAAQKSKPKQEIDM